MAETHVKLITESHEVAQYIGHRLSRATKKMTDEYKKNPIINNASTLARREWIESALASVKQKMDVSTFLPSTLESIGHESIRPKPVPVPACDEAAAASSSQRSERPHLYLAWSEGQRRSGTR